MEIRCYIRTSSIFLRHGTGIDSVNSTIIVLETVLLNFVSDRYWILVLFCLSACVFNGWVENQSTTNFCLFVQHLSRGQVTMTYCPTVRYPDKN